jgi:hypothetical protein
MIDKIQYQLIKFPLTICHIFIISVKFDLQLVIFGFTRTNQLIFKLNFSIKRIFKRVQVYAILMWYKALAKDVIDFSQEFMSK